MEKDSYYTYEELEEEGIARMEAQFKIILRDMRDPRFFNKSAPDHCTAWRVMREWRDRIVDAKNLFQKA